MASERQKKVSAKVIARWLNGHRWYRAETSGERVTLASLERSGVLMRRVWRGTQRAYSAHEYRPSNALLTELARATGESPVAAMSPVHEEASDHARRERSQG